jgi:hypothetical protein
MSDQRGSSLVAEPAVPIAGGGSIPTLPLHLKKSDYWVKECPMNEGRVLIERYHYSHGTSKTRVHTHGLYKKASGELVGCAWWLPPTRVAAESFAGTDWRRCLALSRLVIAPGEPTNACSFLLSKSVKLIDRNKWHTLITYADSWRGHTGAIYKAAGWKYMGETKPSETYVLNGRMVSKKSGPKTRSRVEMLAMGAEMVGKFKKSRWMLQPNMDLI